MAEMELDVIVLTEKKTNGEQSTKKNDDSFRRRLFLFLWERKKAIVFRVLAFIAIAFDVYSVWKKYSRNHYIWVICVIFLILNPMIGSIYSLCCEVLEKSSLESPSSSKKEKKSQADKEDYTKMARSDSVQGFTDVVMTLDYDSDSSTESSPLQNPKPTKTKKKKVALRFDDTPPDRTTPKRKKIMKGTYVEPGIMDPKMEGEEDFIEPAPAPSNIASLSVTKFFSGVKEYCSPGMIISHIMLFPKEYRFYTVSKKLWEHYCKEPSNKEATSMIKKRCVKEVSFKPLWNEYIYREIISKQLSLIMAVLQTIPMTFIELLYWSMYSQEIAKYADPTSSFFDVSGLFDGEQFNFFELVSLMINMINISYRLVSLMNQIRKLNFSKQDMGLFHMIYLTLIYFFLVTSRVVSLYFVMCLNTNGIIYTLSILCVQFSITYFVTKDLYAEGNQITMIISNVLMLFLYAPPKLGKRITMLSYNMIILIEMLAMLVFGHFQLPQPTENSTGHIITIVGQDVSVNLFYWFYGSSMAVFIFGWVLNNEAVSRCLFKYREKMDRTEIREVLREANAEFGTDYRIIVGYFGQDKSSFSAQQTIHLF